MTGEPARPGSLRELLAGAWESRAAVLCGAASEWTTPSTLFDALVKASTAHAAGEQDVMLRLYEDGVRRMADLAPRLPCAADNTLTGYSARIAPVSFALVVHGVQVFDLALWRRARAFSTEVLAQVGLPASRVDADVFLGDYRTTPFGVHKDTASTFSLVLMGRKRMRVWPFEVFADKVPPGAIKREASLAGVDVEPYLDRSIVLEGSPGDVLYWPSTFWHVGESDGGLHASVNLSFYFPWRPLSQIEVMASRAAEVRLGPRAWVGMYPNVQDPRRAGRSLPDSITEALDELRRAVNDPTLDLAVAAAWLNRLSASGFTSVPAPLASVTLCEDDAVRGDPEYPTLWREYSNDRLLCSANGHAFVVPAHPDIAVILARANSGEVTSVSRLLSELAVTGEDSLGCEDICDLLEQLCRLRAVTRIAEPQVPPLSPPAPPAPPSAAR